MNQALLLLELLSPERYPEGLISKQPLTVTAEAQGTTGSADSACVQKLEQAAAEVRVVADTQGKICWHASAVYVQHTMSELCFSVASRALCSLARCCSCEVFEVVSVRFRTLAAYLQPKLSRV